MDEGYVLVVDDDEGVRSLLRDALTLFGLEGRTAANGIEALSMVRERMPRAIVLDLMMPGMDGFRTLTRLQKSYHSRHVPIILLSGLADSTRQALWMPGVSAVIRKGDFSLTAFRSMLTEAGLLAPAA